jgi:hypothetical protein
MNKLLIWVLILISCSAFADNENIKCITTRDDESITFCQGDKVLIMTDSAAGLMKGPMTLVSLKSEEQGQVKLKNGQIEEVIPFMDVAVMSGCNENGVCIGNDIKIKNINQIYKVAGIFVYGDVVIQVVEARTQLKPIYLLVKVEDFQKL